MTGPQVPRRRPRYSTPEFQTVARLTHPPARWLPDLQLSAHLVAEPPHRDYDWLSSECCRSVQDQSRLARSVLRICPEAVCALHPESSRSLPPACRPPPEGLGAQEPGKVLLSEALEPVGCFTHETRSDARHVSTPTFRVGMWLTTTQESERCSEGAFGIFELSNLRSSSLKP